MILDDEFLTKTIQSKLEYSLLQPFVISRALRHRTPSSGSEERRILYLKGGSLASD